MTRIRGQAGSRIRVEDTALLKLRFGTRVTRNDGLRAITIPSMAVAERPLGNNKLPSNPPASEKSRCTCEKTRNVINPRVAVSVNGTCYSGTRIRLRRAIAGVRSIVTLIVNWRETKRLICWCVTCSQAVRSAQVCLLRGIHAFL